MLPRIVQLVSEELLPETQCGFRQGRSTVDIVFVSRQLLEKFREQHRDLYLWLVDLTKPFDMVDRELLWSLLLKASCPDKFIRMNRLLQDGMTARVKTNSLVSDPFPVNRGAKQGCALAPMRFNINEQ